MPDQIGTMEENALITLMAERRSFPRLGDPGPNEQELVAILQAALRAPDHRRLRPWRFLIIQNADRSALGDLFAEHTIASNPHASAELLLKEKNKAFRAPLILVGIASVVEHPKVPRIEQMLSAGCVLGNVGLAAYAIGLGAVWRTGVYAYSDLVREGLGLSENEEINGFLYIGTPVSRDRPLSKISLDDHVKRWPQNIRG